MYSYNIFYYPKIKEYKYKLKKIEKNKIKSEENRKVWVGITF